MKHLATYPLEAKTIVLPKQDSDVSSIEKRQQYSRGAVLVDTYVVFDYYDTPSGESEVYFCTKGTDKVAFKLYFKGKEGTLETRERIKDIDSKYVMPILDSGMLDGRYYEVFPYYKHGSLINTLELIKESFVLDVVIPSVNEGLHAIHEQGLIHRDIKPHNLFLSDDKSTVVIGDFGVVRDLKDNDYVINQSPLSIRYTAPEGGVGGISSKASDYYSFGMTILDLLFGKDLYTQLHDQDVARNMAYYGIRIPRDISLDVRDLIAALIQTSPLQRASYLDIKEWLIDSSYFKGLSVYYDQTDTEAIRPYSFHGTFYHTITSLAHALNKDWDTALELMADDLILPHVKHTHKERYLRLQKVLSHTKDLTVKTSILLSMMTLDTTILFQGAEYSYDDFVSHTVDLYTNKQTKTVTAMIESLSLLYWQKTTNTTLQELIYKLILLEHPDKNDWILTLLTKQEHIIYNHQLFPTYHALIDTLTEEKFHVNERLFDTLLDPLFQTIMRFKYEDYLALDVTSTPIVTAMTYQFQITGNLPVILGKTSYPTIQDVLSTLQKGFEQKERFTQTALVKFVKTDVFFTYLTLHLQRDFGPNKANRILTLLQGYTFDPKQHQNQLSYLLYLYFTPGEYYYNATYNLAVRTTEELLQELCKQSSLENISNDLLHDWMFTYWMDKKENIEYVLEVSK